MKVRYFCVHICLDSANSISYSTDFSMKDDRFQNQNVLVKLWRLRHYLTIPFAAIRIYYYEHTRELEDVDDWHMSFKSSWGLAKGLAQGKMKWHWYWDELNDDFSLKDSDNE